MENPDWSEDDAQKAFWCCAESQKQRSHHFRHAPERGTDVFRAGNLLSVQRVKRGGAMKKILQLALPGLIVWLGWGTLARQPQTKVLGQERLVSVEPLPEAGGEFCEPVEQAAPATLMAA